MANIVTIDTQACKGCALCAGACPKKIIRMEESARNAKGYHPAKAHDMERCIACAMCAIICPDSAITVEREDG